MRHCFTLLLFSALAAAPVWRSLAESKTTEKDVPWRAQAEIARRGPLVERVDGTQSIGNPLAAIAAAMQPPADDSHKWLFTLVTTRNCRWCDAARRDFEQDPQLKVWVDTRDHTKSWGHWQVVQIEDKSQEWRWRDFRPTAFPTLIVQPPVNGSWGDPHTIVFAHQGYLKPAELDAAIRKAIQLYAVKIHPRRQASQKSAGPTPTATSSGGHEQSRPSEPSSNWNPPVTPPAPLPPVPPAPNYPTVPPQYPPAQPDMASLIGQLLSGLLSGTATANLLLLAILAWQIYRGIARREGIPLLVDDATAAKLIELVRAVSQPGKANSQSPPAP